MKYYHNQYYLRYGVPHLSVHTYDRWVKQMLRCIMQAALYQGCNVLACNMYVLLLLSPPFCLFYWSPRIAD
jgi:hypothetical protein